jgi:hypothetical protein
MLLSKWGVLEEVYAITLHQGLSSVAAENMDLIKRSLFDLKETLNAELSAIH